MKQILKILGLELLRLGFRLMILLGLFPLVVAISFLGIWDGGEIGEVISLITRWAYYTLAFTLIVALPFYSHVYLRSSKLVRRNILLAFATLVSVAYFVFFVYPIKERRDIEVGNKAYVMVTSDKIWNRTLRGRSLIPQSLFLKVRVTIFTNSGKRLGRYYVKGNYLYTRPSILIAKDGTPMTFDGGRPFYFSESPRPKPQKKESP